MPQPILPIPTMDEFRTQLRRHNLKATRQRLAVHEVMMGLGHASADMVCEELSKQGSHVIKEYVENAKKSKDEADSNVVRLSASLHTMRENLMTQKADEDGLEKEFEESALANGFPNGEASLKYVVPEKQLSS